MSQFISEQFLEDIFPLFCGQLQNKRTKNNYYNAVSAICDFCEKDFLSLNPDDIRRYFSALRNGTLRTATGFHFSSNTISVRLSCLRSIGTFIEETGGYWGLEEWESPLKYFVPEDTPDIELSDIPSLHDINCILEAATDIRMRLILMLVLRCGLTSTEIVELTPKQFFVDSENRMGIVFKERNEERYVKIPDEDVRPELTLYLSSVPGTAPAVFLNSRGTPLSAVVLQRMVKNLMIRAGVTPLWTLQDLRNACACHLLASGAAPTEVAYQLGIQPRWMHRYENAVEELELQPCDYSRIRVLPLEKH